MSFLDFDSPKPTRGTKDTSSTQPSSPFLLQSLASNSPKPTAAAQDAADEDALLEEFKRNPKAAMALAESYMNAARAPRQAMTEITPTPGFVLQTVTTKESKVPMGAKTMVYPSDTHVFINVCSSDVLPKPSVATEAEIQKAINAEEGSTYQVPFQLSPPREYRDSIAKSYLVVDTCIHTEAYKRTEKDFDYKLYIMELAMEWVEEKCRVELSRNFQLPDLKSKDELTKRSVIMPKPPAIQEVSGTSTSSSSTNAKISTHIANPKKVLVQETSDRTEKLIVPEPGKDDIALQSRLMPCPKGTMGIIVEIDLPNHENMKNVTLDVVSPDKLVIHSKSLGQEIDQGKEYHAEIDMPNEPVDLDAIQAEFLKETKALRVYTIKKRRSPPIA